MSTHASLEAQWATMDLHRFLLLSALYEEEKAAIFLPDKTS